MNQLLFESPVVVGIVGIVIAMLAVVIWTQVNDKPVQRLAFASAIGSLVLTVVLVAVNLFVVTTREQLQNQLHSMAASLEANKFEEVTAQIHPNASGNVRWAEQMLQRFEFSDARVTRIKQININDESTPPTALVELIAVVEARHHLLGEARIPRFVRVYFMKSKEDWLVNDFEHFEVTQGFRNTPLTTTGL